MLYRIQKLYRMKEENVHTTQVIRHNLKFPIDTEICLGTGSGCKEHSGIVSKFDWGNHSTIL